MIIKLMTHYLPFAFKRFSLLLLASSALAGGALAQSLPDIPPEQIAQDVERRYDSRTGETEYIGGSFDPFEAESDLAGSVSLRSASAATTIDGDIVSGGAFLDIAAVYTTNSPDDFDVRGFEHVDFMSGRPAGIVRYNNKTLDCSRNTDRITYDDSYYRGASYGYIAGIYRIYPRYRGHRNFGWKRGHWRRGANLRRGYRGHGRDGDVRRRRGRHDDDGVTRRRRGHGDSDVSRRRGRPGDHDVRRRRRGTGHDGDGTRRGRGANGDEPRRRRRHTDSPAKTGDQPIVYRRSPNVGDATGRPSRRSRPARRNQTPATAPPPRPSTSPDPRRTRPQRVRPQRTDRASPPSTIHTPSPRPRAASKPSRPPVSRPSQARTNRAVDRAFKSQNSGSGTDRTKRRYYPTGRGYSQTDVYVTYRCVKEETLTVHIPQERLEAARFDGFAVMLVDNAGREVPVFVPPNYVEGFRMATGSAARSPSQSQSSVTYRSSDPDYYVRSAPTAPSTREPIIYGDPGYPQ